MAFIKVQIIIIAGGGELFSGAFLRTQTDIRGGGRLDEPRYGGGKGKNGAVCRDCHGCPKRAAECPEKLHGLQLLYLHYFLCLRMRFRRFHCFPH